MIPWAYCGASVNLSLEITSSDGKVSYLSFQLSRTQSLSSINITINCILLIRLPLQSIYSLLKSEVNVRDSPWGTYILCTQLTAFLRVSIITLKTQKMHFFSHHVNCTLSQSNDCLLWCVNLPGPQAAQIFDQTLFWVFPARMFQDETNIQISRLCKADCPW